MGLPTLIRRHLTPTQVPGFFKTLRCYFFRYAVYLSIKNRMMIDSYSKFSVQKRDSVCYWIIMAFPIVLTCLLLAIWSTVAHHAYTELSRYDLFLDVISLCSNSIYVNTVQYNSFCYTRPCILTHPPPWTKWPPFRRRYFQMHFREWKVLCFD